MWFLSAFSTPWNVAILDSGRPPARAHLGVRISIIGKALPVPYSDLQIFSLGLEEDALMATTGRVNHEADTSVYTDLSTLISAARRNCRGY